MPERESASPQHDPDARLGDLFENLPAPTRQLPTVDDSAPAPGSRRAAREASRSPRRDAALDEPRVDASVPTGAQHTERTPPAISTAPTAVAPTAAAVASSGGPIDPEPTPTRAQPVIAESAPGGRLEDLFHTHKEDAVPAGPKKRKKRRSGCLVALIIVLALVGGVVAGGFWAWNTYGDKISDFMGWGPPADWEPGLATGEVFVTISEGDTGHPVSVALYEAGVTRTEEVFYDYLVDENIAVTFFPGVYRMQEKMTAEAALEALRNEENKLENTVSVAEGGTMASILPGVAETLGFSLEELTAATTDPAAYGVAAPSLEGWLFPAVYTFDPDVTPAQVIQRMVDRTRESLAAAGVPDADAERILTIASIIQREGRVADFDKVSRVIQNRLDAGMKLQMDSTAQFGVGELHAGSVSTSEEAQFNDNPWNTYVIDGLPLTPISTASDAAIAAAMHPADGPWFYFVTVNPDSGETVFTTTYAEHEAAIEQWAAWCEANGNPENGCSG